MNIPVHDKKKKKTMQILSPESLRIPVSVIVVIALTACEKNKEEENSF